MDAVKFLKELKRMCQCDKGGQCDECPMKDHCLSEEAPLFWKDKMMDSAVPIVEKWSAEHPVKTRLQDFMEKHPGAEVNADDLPPFMPSWLGYCGKSCYSCERQPTDKDCWDLPVEE